jgi:hypothetical protein
MVCHPRLICRTSYASVLFLKVELALIRSGIGHFHQELSNSGYGHTRGREDRRRDGPAVRAASRPGANSA